MSSGFSPNYQYQPGGSLPPDAPTYVTRQADQVLCEALLAREYCYILNARQMGKSSLRIRTMGLLREQNIACSDIELSGIGSQQITALQWYGGLIQELVSGFELSFQRRKWMQAREDLSPVQRLAQFIETVLLIQIETPIVIFIDEIDSVLGLSFPTDEFFALIRHCYEKRATNAIYRRLTFVLLGVATPSDLMRSKQYSPPFNIGRAIPLQGFELRDCGPLIDGLSPYVQDPQAAMEAILSWSGGQPFLTQKLCWLVTQRANSQTSANMEAAAPVEQSLAIDRAKSSSPHRTSMQALVADIVQGHVLLDWEANDEPEHLRTIRDRLLREAQSNRRILELYLTILQKGSIAAQDIADQLKLRLSGVVGVYRGWLRVKNPIYATLFNANWVEQKLSDLPKVSQIRPMMATLVFSGVDAFTTKMAQDEYQTLTLLQQDLRLMSQYSQRFGGTVLKTVGDQLMLLFETPEKAVQYSIEVQKILSNATDDAHHLSLQHRIGIHVGEILFDGQQCLGAGVNLTTQLQTLALPGGICLSQKTFDTVQRHLVTDIIDMGEQSIQGWPEPLHLYQIPPYRSPFVHRRWPWQGWRRASFMEWPSAIAIGLGITSLVVAATVMGALEGWELRAFDQWMRWRPDEGPDDRLLLVTITEADVQSQPITERGAASLSDQSLIQLLSRLQQGNPRAIGLDIYREQPVDQQYTDLATTLAENDRLFAICHFGDPGVSPPPESPLRQHGFNNVLQDRDGVLRRQILAVASPSPCLNGYALNWWLASQYLQDEGIESGQDGSHLTLGSVTFTQIPPNIGGYRTIDTGGHQVLINYRATDTIAETFTLRQVFSDDFDLRQVTNRIVLIGVVAPSFNDHDWFTPYSSGGNNPRRMTGVEIQAHMVSQMLSAVLDDRPLLWSWSEPMEWLWIGVWTVIASGVAMKMRSRRYLTLVLGSMVLVLSGTCWLFFCYGGWIPFMPTTLGILGGGIVVNGYRGVIASGMGNLKRHRHG